MRCGCGQDDCMYVAYDYAYCPGCNDHHRGLVGDPCPVDVVAKAFDLYPGAAFVKCYGPLPTGIYNPPWTEARV